MRRADQSFRVVLPGVCVCVCLIVCVSNCVCVCLIVCVYVSNCVWSINLSLGPIWAIGPPKKHYP